MVLSYDMQHSATLLAWCQVKGRYSRYFSDFVNSWTNCHPVVKQGRQCTYKCKFEARSGNHFCCGKAITVKYYECVSVALVIQHAKRMRHIILSSMACLAVPYFLHYLINGLICGKVTEYKMCVFLQYNIFLKHIKFHQNPSSGSRYDSCGQMDGQTWQN